MDYTYMLEGVDVHTPSHSRQQGHAKIFDVSQTKSRGGSLLFSLAAGATL